MALPCSGPPATKWAWPFGLTAVSSSDLGHVSFPNERMEEGSRKQEVTQSHIERRREKKKSERRRKRKKEHEKEEGAESDRTGKHEFQKVSKNSPNFLTRPVCNGNDDDS